MKRLILLMVLISLFAVGLVSAVDTVVISTGSDSCINSGTCSLDSILNVTFATVGNNINTVNCSISFTSSLSGNTSGIIINISNTTTLSASTTLAAAIVIEDATDYSFTPTCQDGATGENVGSAVSSVTIDRTVPTLPTSVQPGTTEQDTDTLAISATVTGTDTTACTLTFETAIPAGGTRTVAMTHTGNTCTSTFTGVADASYGYSVTASDGTNTTSATTKVYTTIQASGTGSGGVVIIPGDAPADGGVSGTSIAFLLIIILVGYMVFIRKK